jgi:glycosyltransferase involved in cell wall biosynthesis
MKALLSIVVPTKNRYKYLKHLINLINSFKSDEIELVIQDNSEDNSEILKYLEEERFPNIKYFYCMEKLSMSANADLAIQHSSGEYVCFIGDDDGVTFHIISCTHWMKENDIDALSSKQVSYYWEDYNRTLSGNLSNMLLYTKYSKKCKLLNTDDELKKIIKIGFQNKGDIPLVYTGIIKRTTLEKVFQIGGTYFPGPSPDMSSGVSLCFVVEKHVKVDFPIVITGISKMTGGGIDRLKSRITNIEDVPFVGTEVKKNWEKTIPPIWAGEFAWPESGIKALRYMKQNDYINKVNFEFMLAYFMVFHFPYRRLAFLFSKNKIKMLFYFLIELTKRYFKGFNNLMIKIIFKRISGYKVLNNINDIVEANQILLKIEPVFEIIDIK